MAEATVRKNRPKHLNLMQIRLPLPGILSILHRVSGAGLFLCLPLILFLFGASLGTPEQLETYRTVVANPLVKLVLLGLLWAFLHHFCAGIRFLLLDVHVGVDLPTARMSSVIVFAVSLALTVVVGVKLW
ncbi:succinate dehydrogenase, cytochrome b556 subunit [Uliginosibacterium sp. sgz301328]|uniref:succinate dehydrogenase, cytochrome b556 subunit n=1 Tax=Uliginosibacterium sp. sgz301328 TaxID=3243764 RepID=UPI00359E9B54